MGCKKRELLDTSLLITEFKDFISDEKFEINGSDLGDRVIELILVVGLESLFVTGVCEVGIETTSIEDDVRWVTEKSGAKRTEGD
jgi:hypothetical protein